MGEEVEKTLKRRARDSITGKNQVIGNMSYKEWYDSKVKEHGKAEVDKAYKNGGKNTKWVDHETYVAQQQHERYVARLGAEKLTNSKK